MAGGIYTTLGSRVREEREAAGYTQEALGERADLSGAYVAHIERGTKRPTLATLAKLAEALGVTPVDLLRSAPKTGAGADRAYINRFARLIRGKTERQKKALLRVVQAAVAAQE
jgi:transcriptional regulator with XRE-family HTH domain